MISNIINELYMLNAMRTTDLGATECKFSRLIDILIRYIEQVDTSQLKQIETNLRYALTELEEQKKQIERLDKATEDAVTLRGVM